MRAVTALVPSRQRVTRILKNPVQRNILPSCVSGNPYFCTTGPIVLVAAGMTRVKNDGRSAPPAQTQSRCVDTRRQAHGYRQQDAWSAQAQWKDSNAFGVGTTLPWVQLCSLGWNSHSARRSVNNCLFAGSCRADVASRTAAAKLTPSRHFACSGHSCARALSIAPISVLLHYAPRAVSRSMPVDRSWGSGSPFPRF